MKTSKLLKITSILLVATIFSFSNSNAQERNKRQQESLLSAKKWTIVEVKRKKLGKLKKMDGFRLEVGNEFSLGIDHKFGYKNNDYEYMSGKWVLNGKELLLIHDARDATNRLENTVYKIKRLSKSELFLKRISPNPKGKIVFR
ncbi:MAG: hypothetical protein L3J29_00675 [Cyclobacteriaceae bacterium]|nr:hypothetical protein [Cyclobacteriaceae bacterium]